MKTFVIAASVALGALAASASMKTAVRIAPITIPAGTAEKTISIDIHAVRAELLAAAKSRRHDVTLELDAEAERSPQVFYEVHVGKTNVGNIALYGVAIRSEAQGTFHPAHVQLFISDALLRNRSARTLKITFVANGGQPAEALLIRNAAIVIGPRQRE